MNNITIDQVAKTTEEKVRECTDNARVLGDPMYRQNDGVPYYCGLNESIKACNGSVRCPNYSEGMCYSNGRNKDFFSLGGDE